MFNGDYMFITMDFKINPDWKNKEFLSGYNISTAFSGFLDISAEQPSDLGDHYNNFTQEVRTAMNQYPFFHKMEPDEEVTTFKKFHLKNFNI